jgi:3-oxoacyl-[acyl-carrier protein] reductase
MGVTRQAAVPQGFGIRFDFAGQLVIVTGGTRGIGRAITERFLSSGAEVVATYLGNDGAAERLRADLPDAAGRLRVERFDVSDYAAAERFFSLLPRPPVVLVNNAGIRKDAVVAMTRPEDWRRVLAVNLDGTFHMSKLAVMAMTRERYGRIINIGSPSAGLGIKGQAAYAASKAGQVALCRALSKEVATRGITVNCVEPGFVDTELLADLDAAAKEAMRGLVPAGRFGTADEIASAVLFLASREAGYVTGTTLRVAGGL